jgi:hypothetical protein
MMSRTAAAWAFLKWKTLFPLWLAAVGFCDVRADHWG